jgi:3'(2'), 5'-bisphosphate nucleotidase
MMAETTTLAIEFARAAGDLLVELQRAATPEQLGTSALKDEGDRRSQQLLAELLHRHRPDDAVLSEEATDDDARLTAERVWIIDPLDGTREFSEGRDDWAVHVALWEHGELTTGAVALPGLGTVLSSADAPRDWAAPARVRLAVSRTRLTPLVRSLAERLDAELVPMGSAGFKAAAVVRGEVDAYVHSGGQYEWDSAAPVAVARAAGLFTSRIDGAPLRYNRPDPYLPDLVVCNPRLSGNLLHTIHTLLEEESDDRGQ